MGGQDMRPSDGVIEHKESIILPERHARFAWSDRLDFHKSKESLVLYASMG
jgi:hypothetical protein